MSRQERNLIEAIPQQNISSNKAKAENNDCAQSCGDCQSCACGSNSCGSCSSCASCGCNCSNREGGSTRTK